MKETVTILLASYNGEKFLTEMIDSVLNQDYENIRLVLSDDNSKDSSVQILEKYALENPERVIHYRSGQRFGCAQKHFMHLLMKFYHDSDYIMFCDQDDVWHKNKVEITLKRMKELEEEQDIPVLVHTDLRVVDGDLNEISPSFCKHSGLSGDRVELNNLLVQNVVTGCTVMINRALAELGVKHEITDAVMMHDWWLALIASAFGKIGFVDEPTIDYRQHGNNSVGAKNVYSPSYLLARLKGNSMKKAMQNAAKQSGAFLEVFSEHLMADQAEMLGDFAKTQNLPIFARNAIYRKYKLYKNGFVRVMAQFLGI